tara:strand:+ start:175 stop:792 length:618 start_codon:yes stop_codon:yes gene_type:complete
MPIAINGNGTITGVTVGGLPDGIVDTDMLAANAVTPAKASGIGGKFASYAIIADIKENNADGGTFTSGAWRTRDLNTEITDEDSIVSISSNQFTLGTGNYLIEWVPTGYAVMSHQSRLYNVTDSSIIAVGRAGYSNSTAGAVHDNSDGAARISITGNKVFEIQHRAHTTRTSFGFGSGTSSGLNWTGSGVSAGVIYLIVKIFKEA